MARFAAWPPECEEGEEELTTYHQDDRYAFAFILGRKWCDEVMNYIQPSVLVRESVPCTLLMYHGSFTDAAFAGLHPPLGEGTICRLQGAGPACRVWVGRTHELIGLPCGQHMGAGYGCHWCKEQLETIMDLKELPGLI